MSLAVAKETSLDAAVAADLSELNGILTNHEWHCRFLLVDDVIHRV